METDVKIDHPNRNTKAFIFFIIAIILMLMASCSKAQDTDGLYAVQEKTSFNITFISPNNIPERLREKFNIRPTYGIMTTDKWEYRFEINSSGERSFTTSDIEIPEGKYFVSDISLYNAIEEKVMYMRKKKEDTSKGSEVVSWVGDTFTFARTDKKYVLQVFYK